jgi:hypothetical protein
MKMFMNEFFIVILGRSDCRCAEARKKHSGLVVGKYLPLALESAPNYGNLPCDFTLLGAVEIDLVIFVL